MTYQYDALNRMTYALENGTTELAYYNYDTLSRRNYVCLGGQSASCIAGGGTNKTRYTYEPDSDLSTLTQTLNAATVTSSYGHNHSHQINGISSTDDFYLPIPVAFNASYGIGSVNEYSSVAGNTLVYSADGNLQTLFPSSGAQTYHYDSENRLISAGVAGSSSASIFYDYDALERRVTKTVGGTALATGGTTTNYLLDGDQEIAELDGSGNVLRRYIPGPLPDERIIVAEGSSVTAPTRTYFHVNHQGSVVEMTDAAGNDGTTGTCTAGVNCSRLAYDEYGNLSSSAAATGEAYRYTGRYFDAETGLYYYRTRYYASQLGRFMQMDSVRYQDDVNAYLYVHDDPVNFIDHNGKWPTAIHEAIIDQAFPGLSENQRATLKSASAGMDHCVLCQSKGWSYRHAMRAPNQSSGEAKRQTQDWVKTEEHNAQENQGGQPKDAAAINDSSLAAFGDAVHTVADSTSPAHVDGAGNPLPWDPYSWSGVHSHEDAEKSITPEQMQRAVDALHAAFSDTYGAAAEQQAATPPPPPPPVVVEVEIAP